MKNYIGKILLAWAIFALAACADDNFVEYKTDKPESIAQYEYLNAYDALKTYIDRSVNPNFKLGAGVSVSDFLKKEQVYGLTLSNFNEVTAGNAMKYASCVADNGSMDFSEVNKFVDAAQSAGLTIYGHTLLWHAQQNNTYLNGLIANKEIEVDPNDANKALHINTPEAKDKPWDWEIYYNLSTPLTAGVEYTISMRAKASTPVEIPFWPGDGTNTQYLSPFIIDTEWSETSVTFTAEHALTIMRFCFGTFGGDLFFDDLSLKATGTNNNLIANTSFDEETLTNWSKPDWLSFTFAIESMAAGPSTWWTNLLSNSDCEGDDVSCFYVTEKTVGPKAATFGVAGTGADGVGRAIVVQSDDNPVNAWDTQFFVKVPLTLQKGDAYRFSMKVRAEKNATLESQAHNNPGGYLHWSMVGSPDVTTQWKEYTKTGVVSGEQDGMNTIAFNLSILQEANTYYFDDISFEIEESGNTIPLTPEEKSEVLTTALETWIKGMMEACGDYVTAWDVVNEAVSGGDFDGDGIYDLQSVKNVSEEDAKNNFYWQDYLGNEEFVRLAVKFTRQHGPQNMQLFVNDYNLESDWDDNGKLKSLIKWIERWEADGVTRIDGIGSQMHVSCYMNPDTQQSKENHIVKMFELLKTSGKLIKISELDMGLVDVEGNNVLTENVTEEQHKAMANFYKFIIQKYFEIIPSSQQYGITQWAVTDSPANSGWRGGEPIGLWDLNYSRKHTYAGFADGLSGK
ncbi:endo-1,4-beta-xylanase [Bacteroides sp. 519]|uniref:endo-1,4-beta-xylanase n=1 Tax=Bacteroides sp. 519 TaxID=2302937 RepID=UPI0013D7FE5C|nr:endo-1,4-beta-xylanase [Bacteroides sp. 519]NDV57112.1 glycosyl hydrolase family 10 [Bacteroides sp. 519]